MDPRKRRRIEEAGFTVSSVREFLGLTPEEAALVEMKVDLSRTLRERRSGAGLTQAQLAKRLGSSQSRVAKMEAADPSVSVDLLVRGLLATGATRGDVGAAFDPGDRDPG